MNATLPLERFSAVTLDDLVSEAELLTRVDRKYLIPVTMAAQLLTVVDPCSRVLEIEDRREFAYDSVYFDTPDYLSYRLTAQRRRRRFKLRTRTYVDTGAAYLELKTKSGRGSTVKQRIPYGLENRSRITPEGADYVASLLRQCGHDPMMVAELEPSVTSRYRRTTLLLPCGSRATFDTRLTWIDPDGRQLGLYDYAIVETKSAGPPSSLDRALWRRGQRPSGISKFGTGTAALHPELPGNKWARVLRGPFATADRLQLESDAGQSEFHRLHTIND